MDGHFDCISHAQVFKILCLESKIFQFCLTSRIWAIALKPKLCMSVSRTILAAIFNQAEVAVWVAIMPLLREVDIKHIVQIGSLLSWRQPHAHFVLCDVHWLWLRTPSQTPCPSAYFKSFTSSVRSICLSWTAINRVFSHILMCFFSVEIAFLVFKDASRSPHSRTQMNSTEYFLARTHGINVLCHFPIVVDGNIGNMRSRWKNL